MAMGAGGVVLRRLSAEGGGWRYPLVLFSHGDDHAVRFSIRPLVLVMAKRVGLRPVVIFGTVM